MVEVKRAIPTLFVADLADRPYGMRGATIHDPDGNEIYIGQPI